MANALTWTLSFVAIDLVLVAALYFGWHRDRRRQQFMLNLQARAAIHQKAQLEANLTFAQKKIGDILDATAQSIDELRCRIEAIEQRTEAAPRQS